eukprot:Sspe_Gene.119270::Locus_114695_Transcript_1_2_Confidence_0.600_Length_1293::g.119270::m.119270
MWWCSVAAGVTLVLILAYSCHRQRQQPRDIIVYRGLAYDGRQKPYRSDPPPPLRMHTWEHGLRRHVDPASEEGKQMIRMMARKGVSVTPEPNNTQPVAGVSREFVGKPEKRVEEFRSKLRDLTQRPCWFRSLYDQLIGLYVVGGSKKDYPCAATKSILAKANLEVEHNPFVSTTTKLEQALKYALGCKGKTNKKGLPVFVRKGDNLVCEDLFGAIDVFVVPGRVQEDLMAYDVVANASWRCILPPYINTKITEKIDMKCEAEVIFPGSIPKQYHTARYELRFPCTESMKDWGMRGWKDKIDKGDHGKLIESQLMNDKLLNLLKEGKGDKCSHCGAVYVRKCDPGLYHTHTP